MLYETHGEPLNIFYPISMFAVMKLVNGIETKEREVWPVNENVR